MDTDNLGLGLRELVWITKSHSKRLRAVQVTTRYIMGCSYTDSEWISVKVLNIHNMTAGNPQGN